MAHASKDEGQPMVHCNGCGFNVEEKDARQSSEQDVADNTCETCVLCEAEPRMRESYRRDFNAGLARLAEAVTHIVKDSRLRRFPK
jgi:hypothetical protein